MVLRRRGPQRRPHRAPARLGLQALPQLRARLRLRGRLHGPPRRLPLPELRQPPPRAGRRRRVGAAARHPLRRLHAAHAPGLDPRRAAAARALQRLQRARRRRPLPVAGRRAADHRGRARRRRPRLRARGDDRARRAPDLDPAGQEPGRRQRGPAHAGARGRRARPVRRPQRPHRRRPRRLVGVGRRLGDARPSRQAHDLLGHARRRARAADEVRGRADRPPARRRGPRDRARPRARGRQRPPYALPTYTALLELRGLLSERGAAREYLAG